MASTVQCPFFNEQWKMYWRTFQDAVFTLMISLLLEKRMRSTWKIFRVLQRLQKVSFHVRWHYLLGFFYLCCLNIPNQEKVEAIQGAAPPSNVAELQSFIGTANILRRLVPEVTFVQAPEEGSTLEMGEGWIGCFSEYYVCLVLRFCATPLWSKCGTGCSVRCLELELYYCSQVLMVYVTTGCFCIQDIKPCWTKLIADWARVPINRFRYNQVSEF